jgi:cytochrome oxidase Cu insertion factor (SCO1/SenC/PrrC family)
MSNASVRYWLILPIVFLAMYGSFVAWRRVSSAPRAHAVVLPASAETTGAARLDGKPLAEFVLTDEAGKPFESNSLRGKVWVGSFFFTNCPGSCLRLNQALAAMQEERPASDARYISFTCDPDNDTPEALAKYAEHFQADPARWTFLTGPFDLLHRIANDFFHVGLDKATHSDRAFVVDRRGNVRGGFRLTEPDHVARLKKLIEVVEAEPDPTPDQTPEAEPATSS